MQQDRKQRRMSAAVRRLTVGIGVVGIALASGAGVAAAEHAHFVYQPANGAHEATCRYIAEGQTSKTADDPGGHAFHVHVHTGQPGVDANGTDFDRDINAGLYDCTFVNTP